jgi:hypothetical protein
MCDEIKKEEKIKKNSASQSLYLKYIPQIIED